MSGLGAEVLDDDLLDVAELFVQGAQGEEGLDALAARFADADEDAGGEGHLQFAGRSAWSRGGPRALVGRAVVDQPFWCSRSETLSSMIPWETETLRSAAISSRGHDAGVGVGEEAGLLEDELAMAVR